jgi:hypothetical protein
MSRWDGILPGQLDGNNRAPLLRVDSEQTAVAGEGSGCSCIAYSESSRRRRSHFQDWWAAAVERGLGCLLPTAS